MKKVGRNDPCPCGSGKKYKKCHGASNVIMMDPSRYNNELIRLQTDLIEFAWEEFEPELGSMLQEAINEFTIKDEEMMELYAASVVAWAVFYEPLRHGETVFSIFYERNQHKFKLEQVRKNFVKWSESIPSFYEVVSVTEDKVYLSDLRTNQEYQMTREEEQDFEVGIILIGLLIPYVQEHDFFLTLIGLNDVDDQLKEKLASYTDQHLTGDYPNILADLLESNYDDEAVFEWDYLEHELVAEAFKRNMAEKSAPEAFVVIGLMLWKLYTDRKLPNVRKFGSYAAALEYVLQKEFLGKAFQSQKELGEEYGVSSTTVSTHARRIVDAIGYDIDELKDEIIAVGEGDVEEEDDLPYIANPSLVSEKIMSDLTRALEEQSFESDEELEQFLDEFNKHQGMLPSVSDHPRDIAQDLLFEAYAAKGAKRKQLIEEALEFYPNSPDAYLLIAEDAKSLHEKYQLCHQAVIAGKKDLGDDFIKENTGYFWGLVETRPFMRAKEELAKTQYLLGDIKSAITTMEEMLVLNPSDNQGIRYLLLTLYLEAGQYEDAQALLDSYDGDITASFQFNHVLLNYFQGGLNAKTRLLLKEAHEKNPYVKDYLTGKKSVPKREPDYIGFGDKNEAIAYVQESGHLWTDALPLVKEMSKL